MQSFNFLAKAVRWQNLPNHYKFIDSVYLVLSFHFFFLLIFVVC